MAAVFSTSEYEGYEFTTGMILQVGCFFFCCGMTKSHQLVKRTIVVTKKTARTVAAVSMAGLSQGKIYR